MTRLAFILFTLISLVANAQDVEMADKFREDGKIYVVIAVLSIVFICLGIFLWRIDAKVKKLEKEVNQNGK